MNKKKKSNLKRQKVRYFGGKLDGFKNKEEANFQKKHLKAYLKGHRAFRDGYTRDPETGQLMINWYPVIENWK